MTIGKLDGKSCKRLLMGFVAAMAMCATANTVKVTKFHQSYPYSGKATIEYTVSGELPANAVAEPLAQQCGAVGIVTYDLPPLTAPVISPASGTTFDNSLSVSISCETDGAAIYYTTDGSEPTKDSTAYKRFKIYGKTTVKAVAYDAEFDLYSEVATAEYALGSCANPTIAPVGGSAVVTEGGYVFNGSFQKVSISKNDDEGTIRYTFDGSEPTAESAVYSGIITLDDTATIKAKVFSDRYFDSETVTVVFTS